MAGVLLLNMFVFLLAFNWLNHSRLKDLAEAQTSTRNLSQTLDQSIVGTVRNIDLGLMTVADEYQRQTGGGGFDEDRLAKLMEQQQARLPEIELLGMADVQGNVAYRAGLAPRPQTNVADRDYFIKARAAADLVISKPLFGRTSKKWTLIFARRLNRADGSFAGVVYASFPLERFAQAFSTIDVGPHGAVTLRDDALGVVVRYPEPQGVGSTVGSKTVSPEFRAAVDAGRRADTFTVVAGIDNVERIASYRKVGEFPFYVVVALSTEDALADWRREAAWVAALVVLFILTTTYSSRLLFNAWKRQVAATGALMRQETKFHTLADFTYDWEYWQGPDQREILYMTPSCERITGYSAEEFAANPGLLGEIVHPEDRAAMAGHLDKYAGPGEESIDFRILRRDGEIRWIEHSCRPVFESDGCFIGRRVGNRDITERIQVMESLRESERRLRHAQRVAQIGNFELDLATQKMTCSAETLHMFELAPERFDASFAAFYAVVHPDDRQRIDVAFGEAIKNRRPVDLIHRLLLADGSIKYVRLISETDYAADGTPLRTAGTVQDVTLGVLNEQAIAESEERFRTIADYTYDWEYWQGPQGEFLYISPSCQRVTGYAQGEFISNPNLVYEIIHSDDRHIMDAHLGDIRHEDEAALDYRIVRKDGGIRWIAHGCRAVYAKDGRFLGRRASNRDITDRKSIEEQVQQLAYFDTLTGLPNRRMLFDRLGRALSQAKRFQRSLAIMFLDLDNFKQINDTLGHDAGDELLKEVAVRLETCVRSGDTVARQGGDEFIIVLAEIATPGDAAWVAEKIVKALAEPVHLAEQDLQVTTSIGIAVYPINGADDVRELLKKADKAMYVAKAAGRNGYRFYAD